MNTLPTTDDTSQKQPPSGTPVIGSFGKEQESLSLGSAESSIQDLGKEMELPKEVVAVGVKTQPTTIAVPPPVAKFGVKPSSTFAPASSGKTGKLPLSDVQIAEGLHVNISNSLRWLAEWCRYNLKKLGLLQ